MIKFLTSDFKHYHKENGKKIANKFDNSNGIVDHIKKYLNRNNTILFIASDSKNKEKIDLYSKLLFEGLKLSGINFDDYLVLADETKNNAREYIEQADLIFLSGGDTYVQSQFFNELKLRELLSDFNGIIIGQSAGALNMAYNVFNSPEEMEESEPIYFEGLGLTDINIEPHFTLDTSDFDETEIYQRNKILEESYNRKIYGQCNGSHILITDSNTYICGRTYLIEDGKISLMCDDKQTLEIYQNSSLLRK